MSASEKIFQQIYTHEKLSFPPIAVELSSKHLSLSNSGKKTFYLLVRLLATKQQYIFNWTFRVQIMPGICKFISLSVFLT